MNKTREFFEQFLTEKEMDVLCLRLANDLKLGEIGKCYGVTGSRIQQYEARALTKLRRWWHYFGRNQ